MTWGPYYFFYDCPKCGKKYRWCLDDIDEEIFSQCPACNTTGKLVGETKDIAQGDVWHANYEYI